MGNASHCATSEATSRCACGGGDEEEFNAEGLLKGMGERFDQCSPLGCDDLDEYVPDRLGKGLSDKECADISLVRAVVTGDLDEVAKALEKGASVDTQAELNIFMGAKVNIGLKGQTPLMRASALGFEEIAACLVRCRANPGRSDNRGWTALCHALAAGELGIQSILLACPDALAERQISSAWRARKQILDELEENGVDEDKAAAVQAAFQEGGALSKGFQKV